MILRTAKEQPRLLIDGHFDLLGDVAERRKAGERKVISRDYLEEFRQGGVTTIVCSLFVDSIYLPEKALTCALEQVAALHYEVEEAPNEMMLCKTSGDILQARDEGKIGFLLSFEGAEPVSSVELLRIFYELGVRGLGLSWSRRNLAADGCSFTGTTKKGGLTPLGIELVREAERLGMFVDVSHLSDEGLADVIDIASKPFIASHSNARALANTKRNLTEEQLSKMAELGCVVGLNAANIITADTDEEATEEKLIAHLQYMAEKMGIEQVALGLDLCDRFLCNTSQEDWAKFPRKPFDIIKGHHSLPAFLNKMHEAGFRQDEIAKIAGENWLHLYQKTIG